MIPTTNVNPVTFTSAATVQTAAIDSISNQTSALGIANVGASGAQPETSLVKVGVVTGKEYSTSLFGRKACFSSFGRSYDWSEYCSLVANGNHRHETREKRNYQRADAPLTDNPIPSGAIRLFESSVYVESVESLPKDYCSIEQTRSVFIERSDPQCVIRSDEGEQTQETCSVEDGLHVHTQKKRVSMPRSKTPIPVGALSFYQDYSYVSDEVKPFGSFLNFDLNDPPNEAGYSHKFVLNRLSKEKSSYHDWKIPRGWDSLPRSVREKYLDDIVQCYKKGASKIAISKRHGVSDKNINGLLLLKLSRKEMLQANIRKEFELGKTRDKNAAFADACKFGKTLGEYLSERGLKRKTATLSRPVEKVEKSKKKTKSTPMKLSLAKKASSSSEVVFSSPMEGTSSSSSIQDSCIPPKKRPSFRIF